MKQKPKAIIFDLGGVLIDWDRRHLYRKIFDGKESKMEQFLDTVCTLEWNAATDRGYPFAKNIEERVALFPEYEEAIRAYHERWIEMIGGSLPEMVELLTKLKEQGWSLYVLSNWSAETYPKIIDRFPFLGWFDVVVISGAVGANKPDPRIYQALLEQIPHKADECLFIDDSIRNIMAARALGFQAIHFTDAEKLVEELREYQIEV